MLDKLIPDALITLATINPIGVLALFVAITPNLTQSQRRTVAYRTVFLAGCVLVGAIAIGQITLSAAGMRHVPLEVISGIVLLLAGLEMIFRRDSRRMHVDIGHDAAGVRLVIPGTATPAAIFTMMLVTDNDVHSMPVQVATTFVVLLVLTLTLVVLLFSDRLIRVIGMTGASIVTKVMGMIVAVFASEQLLVGMGLERLLV